jgi:hypothetical protein
VNLDEVTHHTGEYKAWKDVRLASVYPVLEGYRDTYAVGARMNFSDHVGLHSIDITAAYTPPEHVANDVERYHFLLDYDHWPWNVRFGYNPSDFYDLFGPTKVSRKGTFLQAAYRNYIINQRPRILQYQFSLAGFTGLDTLPLYQNIEASVDEYASFLAGLNYRNFRRTIGAVEPERGIGWDLVSVNNYGAGDLFSKVYASLDAGVPTGIDHSSLWFRSSAGWSFGDEEETFSNFYFGGFGNNWVDHGPVRRYRAHYAFPGVDLNEIAANNYGKLTLEWVLPPVRFREAGAPGFYLNWMQFSLFTSGIVTGFSGEFPRQEIGNVGMQLDFKLVMFSNLESTLSLGYASAFESGMAPRDEIMVSLKILR